VLFQLKSLSPKGEKLFVEIYVDNSSVQTIICAICFETTVSDKIPVAKLVKRFVEILEVHFFCGEMENLPETNFSFDF